MKPVPRHSLGLAKPRPLRVEKMAPVALSRTPAGGWFADFGRAAFGTVELCVTTRRRVEAVLHIGEKLNGHCDIDRQPPGSVRYRALPLTLEPGQSTQLVEIPPDAYNTGPAAIRMPPHLFEVLPFRYAELEVSEAAALDQCTMHRHAVFYPFDDTASHFNSDNTRLNDVWDLCKYSIKATTFCGIYVDGDRERIAYEADAYINQLSHYGVDAEYEMARCTLEHLLFHPTWPTEWALHFLPMAWADYQYTGRADLLEAYYDVLRAKALMPLEDEEGLISTETGKVTPALLESLHLGPKPEPLRDLIDWPPGSFAVDGTGERDGYDMVAVKTVVNAFYAWNLRILGDVASLLKRADDAKDFRERYARTKQALWRHCYQAERGILVDGKGSAHASLHANMMPAAFGLLPAGAGERVMAFIQSRGMACSVYGAQYLLEACYRLGAADYALSLLTSEGDRSWLNMIRAGSTITLEAWDWRYKKNLDWNHAWGAAPANIIPRFIAGVTPAEPGFREAWIVPRPAGLKRMEAKVPTPHGAIRLQMDSVRDHGRQLVVESPVPVRVELTGMIKAGGAVPPVARYPAGRRVIAVSK